MRRGVSLMPVFPVEYEIVLQLGDDCPRCGRTMVNRTQWRSLPKMLRLELRSDFAGAGESRGLCRSCASWLGQTDPEALLDYERKTLDGQTFVEEYRLLRERGVNNHEIRRVLKMTESAFNMALRRARKRGDL